MSNSYKIYGCVLPLDGRKNDMASVMQLHNLDYLTDPATGSIRFWQHYIVPDIIVSDIAPLVKSGTITVADIKTNDGIRLELHNGKVSMC